MFETIDLEEMALRSISVLNHSRYRVVVPISEAKTIEISIPEDLRQVSFCQVYIAYLQSVKLLSLAYSTRYSEARNISRFFEFLTEILPLQKFIVPNSIFYIYTQWLKNRTQRTGNSIASCVTASIKPIKWLCNQDDKQDMPYWHDSYYELLANSPAFNRSPQNPTASLFELFPDCPYDNSQLIQSMRLVCCWLVLEFDRQRQLLLDNKKVKGSIDDLAHINTDVVPMRYGIFSGEAGIETKDQVRKHYAVLMKAVIDTEDELLIERMYASCSDPDLEGNPTKESMNAWLKGWFKTNKHDFIKVQRKTNKIPALSFSLMTLTYSHLVRPSDMEVYCMQCIFACDRIQRSGLDSLEIDDIAFTSTGTQTEYKKPRRKRISTTAIYKKNSILSDAIDSYCHTLRDIQPRFSEVEKDKAFPFYESTYSERGMIGGRGKVVDNVFHLLNSPQSFIYKSLLDDCKHDADPFLWLLNNCIKQNEKVRKQEKFFFVSWEMYKKNKTGYKPKRSHYVDQSWVGLSPSYIAQSRVHMEDDFELRSKDGRQSRFDDKVVASELTAHSPETKSNIYNNRSRSPEKIKSMRNFSAQVGEAMERDAEKMKDFLDKTKVIDFVAAKKELGITDAIDDFDGLIEGVVNDGCEVGLTGEIRLSNVHKTIFVTTELTAALIIARIDHIDSEIKRLRQDDDGKALKAIIDKVYLEEVLNQFPDDLIRAGKKITSSYRFPFASLI